MGPGANKETVMVLDPTNTGVILLRLVGVLAFLGYPR
jgi:hypothetical protein